MTGNGLKYTSASISTIAETGLLLNYWVLSHSTPSSSWPQRYYVCATVLSSVYVLAEPAFLALNLWIPIPQKFMLLVIAGLHLAVTSSAAQFISNSIRIEPSAWHKKTDTPYKDAKDGFGPATWEMIKTSTGMEAVQVFALSRVQIMIANLLPVLTTAWCNAGLFLFTHSLRASDTRNTPHQVTDEAFKWLAMIAYLVSTLGNDYLMSKVCHRRHPLCKRATFTSRLKHILLLWILRACMRILCGMDASPALTTIYDSELADQWFSPSRYEGVTEFARRYPSVFLLLLPMALSWSTYLFNYVCIYRPLQRRLERLERGTEQEWSGKRIEAS